MDGVCILTPCQCLSWLGVTFTSIGLTYVIRRNAVCFEMVAGLFLWWHLVHLAHGSGLDDNHALICKRGPDVIIHHHGLRDIVFGYFKPAVCIQNLSLAVVGDHNQNQWTHDQLMFGWEMVNLYHLICLLRLCLNQNYYRNVHNCSVAECRKLVKNTPRCLDLLWWHFWSRLIDAS